MKHLTYTCNAVIADPPPPPNPPAATSAPIPTHASSSRRAGHCKNLKADWEKSASALKGVVGIAAVDATESKALASKYGVQVRNHSALRYLLLLDVKYWLLVATPSVGG